MPIIPVFDIVDPPLDYACKETFWVNLNTGKIWKCNEATHRYEVISQDFAFQSEIGTAAALNTPIPMSAISQPVKSTVDNITALTDAAAFHESSSYATSTQGSKADSALQSVPVATLTGDGLISAADLLSLRILAANAKYYRRIQVLQPNVSVGTSNSDAFVFSGLPAEYAVTALWVMDPSSTLALVTAGLFKSAGGVGAVVPVAAMTTLTGGTVTFQFAAVPVTVEQVAASLYFRVVTGKAGATCTIMLEYMSLIDA